MDNPQLVDNTESEDTLPREVAALAAILAAIGGGVYWLVGAIGDWLSR
jgi:hypothetical protein